MLAICLLILQLALTPEQQKLGLMGISSLPENAGMLFIFNKPELHHFWSFGCLLDLDVGFLDDDLILREIHHLPCDPIWKSLPPIHTLSDLAKAHGPSTTIHSQKPYRHALEMRAGWFEQHRVAIGAQLQMTDAGTYFKVP